MLFNRIDYEHWLDQHQLTARGCFQPLFEAIENAFNAIEEATTQNGRVEIVVVRDQSQLTMQFDAKDSDKVATPDRPIGFKVIDNGIGLDEENWTSFKTVFSPHKKVRGGKGMGRLSYLLAFKAVTIESHFQDESKTFSRRLRLSRDATKMNGAKESASHPSGTTVALDRFHDKLLTGCPKKADAIARHIVRHFFRRLTQITNIECMLRDTWDNSVIDLRKLCQDDFVFERAPETIKILNHDFQVTHVRCNSKVASRHEAMLCVGGRVVKEKPIPTFFTITSKPLETTGGESFFYVAFVEGEILDSWVRQDRMSFNLDEEDDKNALPDPEAEDRPSIATIINAVGQAARKFLQQVLSPLQEKHRQRIEDFCKQNVIYRPLLKHRFDELLKMHVGLSDADFEKEVASIYHGWKSDLQTRFNRMAKSVRENEAELDAYRTRYSEILAELSEMTFHELANYVVDRRAVIDFLWDRLRASPNGKFHDEDAIHDVFFPRRKTSNDVAWDESNLWLIDERFAYQQYVASDLEFRKHATLNSSSNDRPDIAAYYDKAFDLTFAFGEGEPFPSFTSVCLIEFKKPERTRYDEFDNPVAQVLRYIREIRKNGARLDDGHTFRVHESSPIHVYVICHLVDEVMEFLKSHAFVRTPDGDGVIFPVPLQNACVQFVSFEKLIADAKKRNDVFFRKLGIGELPSQQIVVSGSSR